MSFQGDVGGIGLADLLQSLARGREGVLSLLRKDGAKSTIGLQDGLLHLLPDPDEDPEIWRNRARQVWVKDPDFRIDSLRMVEIARAQRIETLYKLLDSQGVHFRFAPGPLPEKPTDAPLAASEPGTERQGGLRRDGVYCAGMSVEGMLLEYARISDEAEGAGELWSLPDDSIPMLLDPDMPSRESKRLYAETDAASTIAEIADRLGWPVRQARLSIIGEYKRGIMGFVQHAEVLALAQHELGSGYSERAAARLRAWCLISPYGPMPPVEAQILENEWQAGRLQAALRLLTHAESRTIVRRMDFVLGSAQASIDHWLDLARVSPRTLRIAHVRLVRWQYRSNLDPGAPTVKDLLALSRALLDDKRRRGAAAMLRIVAERGPETTSARLELGNGLIAAGLPADGGPWIVDAARTLLEAGEIDKALPPLRALCEADPSNREARRMLARARAVSVQRTLVRKNSLVTISIVAALSVGAFVQVRTQRSFEHRLRDVQERVSNPDEALAILEANFPNDQSTPIQDLRKRLREDKQARDDARRTAWTDQYREAQVECTLGDPALGLRRALAMKPPPDVGDPDATWPLIADLYNGLAARLDAQFASLGVAIVDEPAQIRNEKKLTRLITDLRATLTDLESNEDAAQFDTRLENLAANVTDREDIRANQRQKALKQDNLARQDILLGAARLHATAGDHERALDFYKKVIEIDQSGKLAALLAKEIRAVEDRSHAVAKAHELALQGQHVQAHEVLVHALLESGNDYLLPWKIDSFPSGARARLLDGSEKVTPFTLESSWNETIELNFVLDGYEPLRVEVRHPGDQFYYFSRQPERVWPSKDRIEAPPVAVGEDHVIGNRSGELVRISRTGAIVWHQKLDTLGGIARAPVFLPKNPGNLLLVTEDGDVWIVAASTGELDGPWPAGAPPIEGPSAMEDGVRVRFKNGALYEWRSRLKPEAIEDNAQVEARNESLNSGGNAGLAVLRRRTSHEGAFESPWTNLSIEIGTEIYTVRDRATGEARFTVARSGEWSYVAWEAPHTSIPHGRLWIADAKGLRSFLP